jgi:hypothetical protein
MEPHVILHTNNNNSSSNNNKRPDLQVCQNGILKHLLTFWTEFVGGRWTSFIELVQLSRLSFFT